MYLKQTIQAEFNFERGQELGRIGLALAVETANAEHPKWSERCWQLFFQWLNKKPQYFQFQIEDFRNWVYKMDLLEKPKSDRAYGFLPGKAARRKMIEFVKNEKVDNTNAHGTPAGLWMKL